MFDKAKQLYQLQKKAKEMQKELKETEIEAKSTDGLVTAVVSGEMKIVEIKIDDSLLESGKKNELERTLINVISEALAKAQNLAAQKSQAMMKDMGIGIPGM